MRSKTFSLIAGGAAPSSHSLAIARGGWSFTRSFTRSFRRSFTRLAAIVAALAGVLFASGGIAACSRDSSSPPASSSAVVVGATAPLTGAQQSLGPSVQQMLQLAESQVNARGGVLGRAL